MERQTRKLMIVSKPATLFTSHTYTFWFRWCQFCWYTAESRRFIAGYLGNTAFSLCPGLSLINYRTSQDILEEETVNWSWGSVCKSVLKNCRSSNQSFACAFHVTSITVLFKVMLQDFHTESQWILIETLQNALIPFKDHSIDNAPFTFGYVEIFKNKHYR